MKKWFDTNYHYIVPEIEEGAKFSLNLSKLSLELALAKEEGLRPRPVILGPVTFLHLSQGSPLHRLPELLEIYRQLLEKLRSEGVEWVQLDEPSLVLELSAELHQAHKTSLEYFRAQQNRPFFLAMSHDRSRSR